ncbi:MAG: NAD-dependent DNA ligase LigA [Ignavibacteriae bacterium]|nr:NAD-dependent DNA ligase LigA [Ignavibacteriota bacterium]
MAQDSLLQSQLNEKRATELREQISKHDYLYYNKAEPIVSDREYDLLLEELNTIEKQHPELITPDSPTHRVGGTPLKVFPTVHHKIQMLSLSNTYTRQEIQDFIRRVEEGLEGEKYSVVTELKYDGVAISLRYHEGIFTIGATRGDGVTGDDITHNIRTIRSIPLKINPVSVNGKQIMNFEVRGEVFILKDDFLSINTEREERGEKLYANPRNLAAGTLKQLDSREVAKRPLSIVCYYLYSEDIKLTSHSENLLILKQMGFPVSPVVEECLSIDEIFEYINKWELQRESLPFFIDGIVLKVNSMRQQDILGTIARSPKWAIAYKYESAKAQTLLNGISFQVGRTGVVTPVAELNPVFLAGSTVSRATLHNNDYIANLDVRVGDTVIVEKGGDVIPKVSGYVPELRTEHSIPFVFPTTCPCPHQSELHRPPGEANYYCNHAECPWQIRRKISHFASRDAMDIEGLGEKVVEQLVDIRLLTTVADIYDLHHHRDQLLQLDRWGVRSVDNLLSAIEQSKQKPFSRVLFSIGIRFVGEGGAKILAKAFMNVDAISEATIEDLTAVPEIGGRIAASIIDFFHDESEMTIVSRLREAGLQFELNESERAGISKALEGKTFVITGELETMSRKSAGDAIEQRGGKVSGSVSKKTSYVVVGANPGSKFDKAQELGVTILNESEFMAILEG